ncbi:MAG: GGDEF domain-containing protein, partial [Planctomycetota bacterium]
MIANKDTQPDTPILNDTSNVEELRAQRVGLQSNVALMTWFFFAVYSWIRGYSSGVIICASEVFILRIVISWCETSKNYRRMMNGVLGATAIGLLATALSVPELQPSILFFPVSIVVASQLLGIKAAFQWLVLNIAAYTAFFALNGSMGGFAPGATLDEMMLICGVGVCIFFCCQQGEEYYHERTKGLVDLGHRLRKKADRLHTLATTDALTGLVNRFQFQIELSECVSYAVENNEKMALLLIDMDGFKEINDTLGHPVGDQALIEVGNRLRQEFRHEAIVARLGGDEFCLICSGVGSDEKAIELGERACQVLTQRYCVDEFEFPLGASIGIAISP